MLRSKRKIKKLEKRFIARADSAFAKAYQRALASGHSVLIAEQGVLCRVEPDGSRTVLKQIEPPTRVKRGLKVIIR